jgi:hypothetical protein
MYEHIDTTQKMLVITPTINSGLKMSFVGDSTYL